MVGDYLRDTIGLSNSEHGAYLLSLMLYWTKGESLSNPELKNICKEDFERVREFFHIMDGRWHHKRVDLELRSSEDRIKLAKEKSAKGNAVRWGHKEFFEKRLADIENDKLKRKKYRPTMSKTLAERLEEMK